jgi:hypothetical protein
MALATVSDYQTAVNMLLWWIEHEVGVNVGSYNQGGTVQVHPIVDEIVRTSYAPQSSSAETAAYADLTTLITTYLAYKKAREGSDTNKVSVTVGA